MQTHSHSELRQRRYPILWLFDAALHFLLCCGVFATSCALLFVILSRQAPQTLAWIFELGARIVG